MDNKLDNRYFNHGKIIGSNFSNEMKDGFLSYSMSVIVDRALPDVKDGLKPVHRRILWAMYNMGNTPDKQHIKCANIVGEVLGKYHPHGDSAAYGAMVRMAQDFSIRYPLVDGHGNFGSIDGDEAAAYRYTEARMSKISIELLSDIKKDTIEWKDNYDARFKEPVVLPSKFPNLLVNGSKGIAVGMATNLAPHNLGEVIDAINAVIENKDISTVELMEFLKGPDFPTGGYIVGRNGIKKAYDTGRGSVTVRSKVEIQNLQNGKTKLIVKEIPYLVNKSAMVEKIADLHKNKLIDGITDLKDLSNREGIRIEIELRKDVQPEVILNQLYKLSPLQDTFPINNNVLVNGTPMTLSIKQLIEHYIDHQIDVIRRRTKFDLDRSQEKAHILEGFKLALDRIDEVIETIKTSKTNEDAINNLCNNFSLDEIQAKAVLDMQLKKLTGLEQSKIIEELDFLYETIKDLKDILANHNRVIEIIKKELNDIKTKFNDSRRSQILDVEEDVEDEDLINKEDIIVSISTNGYIKRLSKDTYKTQNRGGKGIKGMNFNDDDTIDQNISLSTHDHLLIFTDKGKVYRIKGYKVPSATRTSKGIPIVNIINIEKDEKIKSLVAYKQNEDRFKYLAFVTNKGLCKKVLLEEFESIRQNGKIAITLNEDDDLNTVFTTTGQDEIIIAATNGRAVRFNEDDVRASGRTSRGVKGINVDGGQVVGACTNHQGTSLLVVTENGFGKLSDLNDYRLSMRGAKGVKTVKLTDKTGPLIALKAVNGDEDCMIMSSNGVTIKISLQQLSNIGRNTQGVKLVRVDEGVKVIAVTILIPSNEDTAQISNEQKA